MLCEKCKQKQATAYFQQTVNGQTVQYSLCPDCLQQITGQNILPSAFLPGLFNALFMPAMPQKNVGMSRSVNICKGCGAGLDEIAGSGIVGCAQCYTQFREQLMPYCRQLHGESTHRGRFPKHVQTRRRVQIEQEQLKQQLDEAIAAQEYERAAQLRDQIKALDSQDTAANE